MTRIGTERFIASHIRTAGVVLNVSRHGWCGNPETLLDHCDAGLAAVICTEHHTLDAACGWARNEMMLPSLFGAVIIEHETFEQSSKGGSWERTATYEVAHDGECMRCSDD